MWFLVLAILLILSLEFAETSIVIPIILFLTYLVWQPDPYPPNSLEKAAIQIENRLEQLYPNYSRTNAERKVAEELANQAQQFSSFKKNLKSWSQLILNPNNQATISKNITDKVKRVILLACSFLVK